MKNILITGVSKGLGLKTAELFLEEGWTVYGVSRTRSEGLDRILSSFPDRAHWLSIDLAEIDQLPKMIFKDWISMKTPLHALVNNAAVAYDDIVTNVQIEPLKKMYAVNVMAPMVLTKYAIRHMLLHNVKGSLVHLSSISVHTGYKGLAMYASTKGALEAFSKNTAREWGVKGIRSNCVVAGFMKTEMSASLTDDQKNRIYKRTALKKAVSVDSVAETILFLSGNKSEAITGQNIHVDNGTI